jgi:hypothetical protein
VSADTCAHFSDSQAVQEIETDDDDSESDGMSGGDDYGALA